MLRGRGCGTNALNYDFIWPSLSHPFGGVVGCRPGRVPRAVFRDHGQATVFFSNSWLMLTVLLSNADFMCATGTCDLFIFNLL